ncbi:DUF928 domain-containing protein [Cyanobacteria bacterium FACHB-502]|nr:DUF928 domain-containing protein [Cyanobacteria bacterium FACHB-502]
MTKLLRYFFKSSSFYWLFGLVLSLLFHSIPVTANDRSIGNSLQVPDAGLGNQANQPHQHYRPLIIPSTEFRRLASRGGTNGRSRAGTRGDCPAVNGSPELTAIVPLAQGSLDNAVVETAIGTTTAAYPTFWFYLPYSTDEIHSVQFVVNDEQDMPLFAPVTVPLNSSFPGLVSIQLPSSSPPLEVGKYYRWYVMLDCSPQGGNDAFVDAFVQRVALAPGIAVQLETVSPTERINLLLDNGSWHEAVSELYALQMQSPDDVSIRAAWSSMLELGGITSQSSNK